MQCVPHPIFLDEELRWGCSKAGVVLYASVKTGGTCCAPLRKGRIIMCYGMKEYAVESANSCLEVQRNKAS